MPVKPLPPEGLYHPCAPESLGFTTTTELKDLTEIIGQPRALEAVAFGIGVRRQGYNLFAMGPAGVGKRTTLERFLNRRAPAEPVPSDWCYINNFHQPHVPRVLRLPAGWGARLKRDMEKLVEDLRSVIPALFETEEYQDRRAAIEEETQVSHARALQEVEKSAHDKGLTLVRTPGGLTFAPEREGEVLGADAFGDLPEAEQERIADDIAAMQESLEAVLRRVPQLKRETRRRLKDLKREVAVQAVEQAEEDLRRTYAEHPEVLGYLDEVREDVVDNVEEFLRREERPLAGLEGLTGLEEAVTGPRVHRRYYVNLLIDHSMSKGAPVVYEDNPTYANLIGRVEHVAQLGALVTDFHMIKPGALHRANGGYLILDARKVLTQPFAWEGLKRALEARSVCIESPLFSPVATVSLEPETIPLDVKVVLVGERDLYYLLYDHDPDFRELFKVLADFTTEMARSPETDSLYARLIGTRIREEGLRPFDASAVARVVEHAARLAGEADKVSTAIRQITDVLVEADYWAGEQGNKVVGADNVQKALDARTYRADRVREELEDETLRGLVLIHTSGEEVGQVNGLSVIDVGGFHFGRPTRISARVWPGEGHVTDIEREVELSGPIHSKGVLILTGFLSSRYATEHAPALSASLVFEQSYGEIEGDSASAAELYALLSALAEAPLRQSLAVTGSVDQHGRIQAIGGVNEKIEGFFDLCQARGLTGDQGVLIPASNLKSLMLRHDVVAAVRDGRFNIYPVSTVDEGIALLTGQPAGAPDREGHYPEASINGRVVARLAVYAEVVEKRKEEHSHERD